ncbi:hypothetical protein OHV05_37900 (plasmid) [Kitasatospora sp. NBC_00070]|uniref:hypothetical protein n=1 Tax=Kitasatospora sp. NBC_00070 TaxID=2975962 RepID=UPI002F9131A4
MSVQTTAHPQTGQQPYGFGQQTPWQPQYGGQPTTPPAFGQQYGQQPYGFGQQTPWQPQYGGQPTTPPLFGQQYGQQPYGTTAPTGQPTDPQQLPMMVAELALRCANSAITSLIEQLRIDPQALIGMQMQGQIPPHLYSGLLVECARRIAPVLHQTLTPMIQGQTQGSLGGQPQGMPLGTSMPQLPQWAGPSGFGQGAPAQGTLAPLTGIGI